MSAALFVQKRRCFLVAAAFCIIFMEGCTLTETQTVNLRYTPLIQAKEIADKDNPQTVKVGQFVDERPQRILAKHPLNIISTVYIQYVPMPGVDVSNLVQSAFIDAMSKSGFKVLTSDDQSAKPYLSITGKILTFNADVEMKYGPHKITSTVVLDLTISPSTGIPFDVVVRGTSDTIWDRNATWNESEEDLYVPMPDLFDRSLRECVDDLLQNGQFLTATKK